MSGAQVWEVLEERGVNLVQRLIDIAERTDDAEASKIYQHLMRYVYAPRREEDQFGNAAEVAVVAISNEETKEFIKVARGDR